MKFYKRSPITDFPPVIAGTTPENGTSQDRLDWLNYLIAYAPKFPHDLADNHEYPQLPEGVERSDAGNTIYHDKLRGRCAVAAVTHCLNDTMISESVEKLTAEINSHPQKYNKVVIVYPMHFQGGLYDGANENLIPSAMVAMLKRKLRDNYQDNVNGLPVMIDITRNDIMPLYISTKRPRGVVKANMGPPTPETMVGNKLANQIIVDGSVDPKALYWLVDDAISIGGTIRNYVGSIHDKGGKIGVITTLTKRSKGVDCLPVKSESLHALREIMHGTNPGVATKNEQKLEQLLAAIGIGINFDHPEMTTATNQEILLLAGYFASPNNASHQALIDTALRAIGTTFAESTHSYAVKTAKFEQGTIEDLEQMMCKSLGIKKIIKTQEHVAR